MQPTLSFHSADAAYARALSALQPDRADFVLCNTGGDVTRLLVTRDHSPIAAVTLPLLEWGWDALS